MNNKKILIGIMDVNDYTSVHGLDGFSGVNIDASKLSVITTGTEKEIREFVTVSRINMLKAKLIADKIDSITENDYNHISEEEYEELEKEYHKLNNLGRYKTLLMIDGVIL